MTTLDILDIPSAALPVALTLSGNEQTPATRAAGTQGDGLIGVYRDSSIGVWEATTNLVTNGGFETNTTGWDLSAGGASIARVTTERKYGVASLEVTAPSGTATIGCRTTGTALTTGTTYTASIWVKAAAGLACRLRWANAAFSVVATQTFDGTGDWQQVSLSYLAIATETHYLYITRDSDAATDIFYIDGVQIELQPLATPYVHTDGGTASRSASNENLTRFKRYANETQGYAAFLLQMPFDDDQVPDTSMRLMNWQDDGNNRLIVQWVPADKKFYFERKATTASNANIATTFAPGDLLFVLMVWNATTLGIAVNGGAFTTAANTLIPTLASQTMCIGSLDGTANHMDSTYLFKAFGKAPSLTTGFSAALNNIARNNRIDSRPEDLPGGCTFKWPYAGEDWRNGVAL